MSLSGLNSPSQRLVDPQPKYIVNWSSAQLLSNPMATTTHGTYDNRREYNKYFIDIKP